MQTKGSVALVSTSLETQASEISARETAAPETSSQGRQLTAHSPLPVQAEAFPVSRRVYRPELDALRFFAFLAVYLHHVLNASPSASLTRHPILGHILPTLRLSMGFGLCLFFLLSSYLITSLLQLEQARAGRIDLRSFYLRRILRIWPLYLCFLVAAWALGLWWQPAWFSAGRLLAFVFIVGNWYSVAFGLGSYFTSHLWSISVEEQFYLLWPWLLGRLTPSRLFAVCCVVCGVSLAITATLAMRGASAASLWFNSLVQALFFGAGGMLASRLNILSKVTSGARAALGIGSGLALWLAAAHFSGITNHGTTVRPLTITLGYATVAAGCALLLWGALHLPHALLPRPLIYLGRISYGLYVFHMPVLILLGAMRFPLPPIFSLPGVGILLGLAITVGLAALSYELLEKPFLRLKGRFEVVRTRPV